MSGSVEPSTSIEDADIPNRQSTRYLVLYAMAAAGGSASYAPFLTVVLPNRVIEIGSESPVQILSSIAFLGAIAASVSNLFFGWLSDRTQNRTGWILAGVALSSLLLVSMRWGDSIPRLVGLICAWQFSLNMMLSPLAAWAGDCVPDNQKGTLGGLLSFAPGIGALVGAVVTIPGLAGDETRLILIACVVCALVSPVVFFGRPRSMPQLVTDRTPSNDSDQSDRTIGTVWRMWLARLFIQIAEAALFAFLLLWLKEIDPDITDNNVATIFAAVLFGSVPIAIVAGRWSDRAGSPMTPLIIAASFSALGLFVMAGSHSMASVVGYCIFGTAAAVFLALHSSQTLRVLPKPKHRGRDLGVFNLTNTIPSLIMPGLSLALIPIFGFQVLFVVLALLVAIAVLLLATRQLR